MCLRLSLFLLAKRGKVSGGWDVLGGLWKTWDGGVPGGISGEGEGGEGGEVAALIGEQECLLA